MPPIEHTTDDATSDAFRELLSERLLADFPVAAWRDVYLGSGAARIAFVQQSATLVCCDPPHPEWAHEDLEALSTRLGGHFELFGGTPLFRFASAQGALGTALLLQRTCRRDIRVALLTGRITVAHLELFGQAKALAIGEPIDSVLALMCKSLPGSIRLCPISYRILASGMDRHAKGAMVTTEYHGHEVTSALVTPPPTRGSEFSTFAGLGLT
jgi:hypothetical protein